QQPLDIGHLAYPATDGQRDEDLGCHRLDDGQDQVAAIAGGSDVQEGELVGALLVIALRDFYGVPCVDQVHDVDALYDSARRDVQTGDDASGEVGVGVGRCNKCHASPSSSAISWAAAKPSVPS